jgi:hypothetical protein
MPLFESEGEDEDEECATAVAAVAGISRPIQELAAKNQFGRILQVCCCCCSTYIVEVHYAK